MKILHICKKYPNALGGDAVVVANLQKRQEAAGHQVAILTSNCQEIISGPHIYTFGLPDTPQNLDRITARRLFSLLGLFFTSFAVLGKERPDVVHVHSVDMAFFASFAARWFRIPMIHTFHIVTFYDPTQPALRRKAELLLAKAAGLRLVTAPNAHDVAALQQAGLSQAVLLPNGVDLEFWQRDPVAKKNDVFTFLSFGRLEEQKGYAYLIRAVALLKRRAAGPFRVIIAGDGNQKQQLQEQARAYRVQHLVRFVGHKTPRQMQTLLSQADVVILASLYETTPLTLLEAWAIGAPVIATSVGILRTMRKNSRPAYLVQPGNEQALQIAMQHCMNYPELQQELAAAGHQEVKKYAWAAIAKQAESLYGNVL